MARINDFGEKIGGARKDVWKMRGLIVSDLEEMNEIEKNSYVKKDNIWPKPDWVDLVSNGTPSVVAYWQNEMRKSLPAQPPKSDDDSIKNYVKIVGEIKEAVMSVKTEKEIENFHSEFIRKNYIDYDSGYYGVVLLPEAKGIITNKVLKAAQQRLYKLRDKAEKSVFGTPKDKQEYVRTKNSLSICKYDEDNVKIEDNGEDSIKLVVRIDNSRYYHYLYNNEYSNRDAWELGKYFVILKGQSKPLKININSYEEAETFIEELAQKAQERANEEKENPSKNGKKNKRSFTPPQLADVKREGPKYRGLTVNGEMFLDDLNFRGVEFGNWLDDRDRQASLNMGYDALKDLARVLKISPEDISFGGKLAIAYGSRGKGGIGAGAAHYEPLRRVINLTKMSGAGCLAHEWGHALDHAIGLNSNVVTLASESKKIIVPESFQELLNAMRYKKVELSEEERRKKFQPEIDKCTRNLRNWIDSTKPSNLTDSENELWDSAVNEIINHPEKFTGLEYQKIKGIEGISTNPEVETLSAIRKSATKYVIPNSTKIQFALWARDLKWSKAKVFEEKFKKQVVDTDFYKGSYEFDNVYSKAGHGYYRSTCEMFARAFDCYISDKLKEEGSRSDYLTSFADSFVLPDGKGGTIAAIPQGEERKLLNEKFDILIKDLKELGILHDYVEEIKSFDDIESNKDKRKSIRISEEPEYYHSEQLSFDALLFNAEQRSKNQKQNTNKNYKSERDYSI